MGGSRIHITRLTSLLLASGFEMLNWWGSRTHFSFPPMYTADHLKHT